jgi:hypothetical protein
MGLKLRVAAVCAASYGWRNAHTPRRYRGHVPPVAVEFARG